MKIVIDILIDLRKRQAEMVAEHLSHFQSAEALSQLNGMYRGLSYAIEQIEQVLKDEQDRD